MEVEVNSEMAYSFDGIYPLSSGFSLNQITTNSQLAWQLNWLSAAPAWQSSAFDSRSGLNFSGLSFATATATRLLLAVVTKRMLSHLLILLKIQHWHWQSFLYFVRQIILWHFHFLMASHITVKNGNLYFGPTFFWVNISTLLLRILFPSARL